MSFRFRRSAERGEGLATALGGDVLWPFAIFLAALWNICREIGTSPRVWEDTLIENLAVRDCVTFDRCNAVGVGSTFGIFHSAGYLHWRALLDAIGLHADGTFRTIVVINALGVALTAVAARRLGGRIEAAIAALVMAACIGVPTQLDVITDLAPMPFLGAVFLLLAVSSLERPNLDVTALLALVGGVTVNFYATGALLGVSAVWVALLQPKRRWAHALVAAVVFAGSAFALSPPTWIADLHMVGSMHRMGNAHAVIHHPFFGTSMALLAALAVAVWLTAALVRSPLRRALAVPAAIVLPLFVPFALGAWSGHIDPQYKYFSHIIGAVAVTLALGCTALLRRHGGVVARRAILAYRARIGGVAAWPFIDLAILAAGVLWAVRATSAHEIFGHGVRPIIAVCVALVLVRLSGAAVLATLRPLLADVSLEALAPYAAALAIAVSLVSANGSDRGQSLKFDDLQAVVQALGRDRHWSLADASADLKTPDDIARRALLHWAKGWPTTGSLGISQRAWLVKASPNDVPDPAPEGLLTVASNKAGATLVALGCSWIDWRSFRACTRRQGQAEETCTETGLPVYADGEMDYDVGVPGLPKPELDGVARQALTLHLPLHPTAECPDVKVVMVRIPRVCPGRVVGVDGATSGIEDDGRRVELHYNPSAPDRAPRELAVEWDVGSPSCWNEYRGYPPFFLEGNPKTVELVRRTLTAGSTTQALSRSQ